MKIQEERQEIKVKIGEEIEFLGIVVHDVRISEEDQGVKMLYLFHAKPGKHIYKIYRNVNGGLSLCKV